MAQDEDNELESAGGENRGMPVDVARVFRAVFRGKWWLVGAVLVGGALGYSIGKFGMTSSYISSGTLKFEGVEEVAGVGVSEGDVASLADSLSSREVLGDVRTRANLVGDLTAIKARIVHLYSPENQTIQVIASEDSAESAAGLVTIVMEEFMEYQSDRHQRRLQEALENIDERLAAIQTNLTAERDAYDSFREEYGIGGELTTDQEQQVEVATAARTAAGEAAAQIGNVEGQLEALRAELEGTPESSGPGPAPERAQIRELEQQLSQLQSRFTEDHPQIQALRQQIQTLRLRMAERGESGAAPTSTGGGGSRARRELQQIIQAKERELAGLREQASNLERLAAEEAARVDEFSQIEGQAIALRSRVRVSETLANTLREQRTLLEDAMRQPTSGFSVITPAQVPEYPEPNKAKYMVAAGIPAGLALLVLCFLLWRELKGLRVRTAREVGYWGKGPVLGTTTWPRDRHGVQDLIADLDDFAPEAKGRMLVVGATDAEASLAQEIVDQLNNDWFPSTLIDLESYATSDAIPLEAGSSSALAVRQGGGSGLAAPLDVGSAPAPTTMDTRAWDGPVEGQALRRAARLADRVMVVVTSGAMSAVDLAKVPTRLGRKDGLGYILVGIEEELSGLPDRAGRVQDFWRGQREA